MRPAIYMSCLSIKTCEGIARCRTSGGCFVALYRPVVCRRGLSNSERKVDRLRVT
jgi:hypothetical protein